MINWIWKRKKLVTLPEALLLKKARRGDRYAYGQLYLKYLDSIYRFVLVRVGKQTELAEDLTADVFRKAWQNIGSFDPKDESSFKSWLYQIARNQVIDFYRTQHVSIPLELNQVSTVENLDQELEVKEDYEHLIKSLNQLSNEQQEVIILRFVEELSHSEVAEIIGKSEEAVRALQYRALKRLKQIIDKKNEN